ncbi:hypothetical protein [Kordiimonas aquimaris]|uniref:hypothetical protein n=1 Tax=Kordiimonas aquimaris TaxID=707591 RepID=UPI0021D2A974|nr:hypothetical protein [Kordiimonas aquimaris]
MKFIACRFLVLWFLAFMLTPPTLAQTSPFNLGGQTIAPGTIRDLTLVVAAGRNDPATHIPVTVIHSNKEGPVVTEQNGSRHSLVFGEKDQLILLQVTTKVRDSYLDGLNVIFCISRLT